MPSPQPDPIASWDALVSDLKHLNDQLASPPPGWATFGTYLLRPELVLEFWGVDTDGLPLWERPIPTPLAFGPTVRTRLARRLARFAHRGQTDKSGIAYWRHPARVAARAQVSALADGWHRHQVNQAVQVAWLHDVLEDTRVPAWVLYALFGPTVAEAVVTLTHPKGLANEPYWQRIAGSKLARLVKLADIADNTDPARMAALPVKVRARLMAKYRKARAILTATD